MEVITVVMALILAQGIGLSSLILERDLEIVINALKSEAIFFASSLSKKKKKKKKFFFASYGHLIKEAKGLAEYFSTF